MTKVTFENATIRDVIGKAARVAPTKGKAVDAASGILVEVDADKGEIIVKSTNTEIYYMEIVDSLSIEGASRRWRIPSTVIDGICSKLPISSGKSVTWDDNDSNEMLVSSGRMRARVRLMDPQYFPTWGAFDPSELETVPDFGARIQMVQWAASRNGEPPLTGVHLDGEMVCATDHFKIAMAPCKASPIYKPVTIPAGILTPLMKTLGDVRIGMGEGQLYIMPDDSTQIRTVIFGNEYPNVMRVMDQRNEDASVTFKRQSLLEIIDRAMVMGQRERVPILKMIVGEEEIAVMMQDKEIGLLGDVIETPGYAQHDRQTICFTPGNLTAGLEAGPNEEMTMHYRLNMPMKPVRLDGGSGYEVMVMPRKEQSEGE